MLRNLKAKMVEGNISQATIAALIGKSERSVRAKIGERTAFSLPDAILIRDTLFPSENLNVLFASDQNVRSRTQQNTA